MKTDNVPAVTEHPLKTYIRDNEAKIRAVMPEDVSPDRLIELTLNVLGRNPLLRNCDTKSVFYAVMSMASLGLSPDPLMREAYILPYKDKAQLLIGYSGWIKLLRQSMPYAVVSVNVVYSNEIYFIELGSERGISHAPKPPTDRGDKIIAAYAEVRDKASGYYDYAWMWAEEIEKIRDERSTAHRRFLKDRTLSPWQTDTAEMYKKTAIHRLAKFFPGNINISRAVCLDEGKNPGAIIGIEDDEMPSTSFSQPIPTKTYPTMLRLPSQAIINLCGKMDLAVDQDALDGIYNETQALAETEADNDAAANNYAKNCERLRG